MYFLMKKSLFLSLMVCSFVFSSMQLLAQKTTVKVNKSNIKVKKHTLMEQFEPEMVATSEERLEKKIERVEDVERKLSILDTLEMSERKKRKLLRDLKYAPFSERLNKAVIVNSKFEEEDADPDQK